MNPISKKPTYQTNGIDGAQTTDKPLSADGRLSTTLTEILGPLVNVGDSTGTPPSLTIAVAYEYELGGFDSQHGPLTATDAICLVPAADIGSGGSRLTDFCSQLADFILSWMIEYNPSRVGGGIILATTVFTPNTDLTMIIPSVRIILPLEWSPN
jgi:hypothetical protein